MTDHPAVAEAEDLLEKPYDTADPTEVNNARKRSARLRRERLNVIASLMEIKEGRAWLFEMLETAHVFSASFVQGDPHATSFREGERNSGLRLLGDIMAAAPERYIDMVKEGNAR